MPKDAITKKGEVSQTEVGHPKACPALVTRSALVGQGKTQFYSMQEG